MSNEPIDAREVETGGPDETGELGEALARSLRPGDVVAVSGPLGVGKTTLIREAARVLGVADTITSPTFVIGRRYAAKAGYVSHLDLYRLESPKDEDPALLADYLTADAVTFVEWPELAIAELERAAVGHGGRLLRVSLDFLGEDRRAVRIR
ncbi:MAG: tRNA (adenosine(37)-N6)-threonylcarbamoyltransferase complex ATPase subunit type 1 TsaE [Solirubrobacterales bacterium]